MNWELIGNIAFAVFVVLGLAVILGEGIAAMVAKDGTMEARDDLQPLYVVEEPTVPVAVTALHHRPPPYVAVEPDPDLTGPLELWERPRPGTDYRSRGRDTAPEPTT